MATEQRVWFTLSDQAQDRYPTVPFEVPAGARSLEVTIEVPDPDAVIDVGCEGPHGWRGWSGGAHRRFVIAEDEASDGYLPGSLEPGEWSVVLGLHLIPHGVAEVIVRTAVPAVGPIDEAPLAPVVDRPRGSSRRLPAPAGLTWWAGDFHAHTTHSDGSLSIDRLAAAAVESGLDFLAVTDHNTTSHHAHLPAVGARHGIELVPGQEVTTHRGHANAFGEIGWVDFRRPADDWVQAVEDDGGILSINHPTDEDCAWLHPLARRPAAVEAFHITWARQLSDTTTWAYLQLWGDAVLLGGSDFHTPGRWRPGTPTTWVLAPDPSPESILAAVAAGRTAPAIGTRPDASVDPFTSPVLLRLDDELHAVAADGSVLVDADGRRRVIVGEHAVIPDTWGRSPYRLEDCRRWVLAISA